MKRIFTLALVMAMAVTSFAQVKSARPSMKDMKTAQQYVFRGTEAVQATNFQIPTRSTMLDNVDLAELAYTTYDWQSNMGQRNYTAVWPDGYAVMCYTLATDASYSDRGTGLAIWDPAVGEWEYTETRVEGVKTGFGSIARYKENGLIVAAHTSSDCRIFIVEDFRDGNRDFGEGIVLPTQGENGRTQDICWPVVQCSGADLDIIHILATEYSLEDPYPSALLYTRYQNGEFDIMNHVIPNVDENNVTDGGSNIAYFMLYDENRPNRVSFILNNAWSDGKLVISEDNGATWGERVFYQHPNINGDFTDIQFFYPRWTSAEFDANDKLNLVYEWNGSTGVAGSGSYYPGLGGVAFWSETLPKSPLCEGGIGEAGHPFILDSTYMKTDLYYSEWYWSDATHDPLPEYFGELQIIDAETSEVIPYFEEPTGEYYWVDLDTKDQHGSYNGGIAEFATMHREGNTVFAFWTMICGDGVDGIGHFFNGDLGKYQLRLFGCKSDDGGRTWGVPQHIVTDFMEVTMEMCYSVVIPYVYNDEGGDYLWVCYQSDDEPGTYVQNDETDPTNNLYKAAKVYVDMLPAAVEESIAEVPTTMNVYPNPANGAFNVQLNSAANVNIFNTVGQLVKTYENVTEVSVNLESGVYFVNAGNQTLKVVVK